MRTLFLKGRGIFDAADASLFGMPSRFIPHDPSLFTRARSGMTHSGITADVLGQALIEFRRTNKARSCRISAPGTKKTDSKIAFATSFGGKRSPPLTTSFGILGVRYVRVHVPTLGRCRRECTIFRIAMQMGWRSHVASRKFSASKNYCYQPSTIQQR